MTPAALLNHLWQSTVFAAAAAGLAFVLRRNAARVRFWIWLTASLKFLVPFSVLAAVGGMLRPAQAPVLAAAPAAVAVSAPFTVSLPINPSTTVPSTPVWPLLLGGIWLLGAIFLAMRWFLRWRRLARIARAAAPSGQFGRLRVRTTSAAIEPGVFGIFRPVLLLPAGLEQRLTPTQLDAVLAHEQCHARRQDNLWSALHMAVETLFWFHPMIWWIGARLVHERERACDETVLRQGGDPEVYADGIVQVCRYYLESPLACAAGVSGGELKARLAAILDGGWGRNLGRGRRLLLAGVAAVALLGPIAAGIVFGQSATPTAFDAASIKPSAPPAMSGNGNVRVFAGMHIDPERVTIAGLPLRNLLAQAYGLQTYQVSGPDWMNTERFDISAETSAPVTQTQMLALLQPYLTRQFQLKMHHATKEMSAYTLTLASDGPKLKAVDAGEAAAFRALPSGMGRIMMSFNDQGLELKTTGSMDSFAHTLAMQYGRPVVNRTGLTGVYDIDLKYAAPSGMAPGGGFGGRLPPPAAPSTTATPPGSAPSIFTALQQQLGLKIEAGKAPVDVLVIDSGSKTPVGN